MVRENKDLSINQAQAIIEENKSFNEQIVEQEVNEVTDRS